MKRQIKLDSKAQESLAQSAQEQSQQNAALEFASPEELLRHDAIHTPVPPRIANRLQESIGQVPPANKSWWQRWFRQTE
jgi:hypothetical protein